MPLRRRGLRERLLNSFSIALLLLAHATVSSLHFFVLDRSTGGGKLRRGHHIAAQRYAAQQLEHGQVFLDVTDGVGVGLLRPPCAFTGPTALARLSGLALGGQANRWGVFGVRHWLPPVTALGRLWAPGRAGGFPD
ncbi:hypothetical protein RCIP0075_00060 [Klebsiella phage RCIP0075]